MTISDAWVDFIAGWASGAMAVMTCQPMDTVLTRFQAMGIATTAATTTTASTTMAAQEQTRGLIQKFGMTSLWRGSSAMISAVPIQNAMLMGGYGIGKQWANANANANANPDEDDTTATTNHNWYTYQSVFVGGCTGGILQSFLMSPVEFFKVNQQVYPQQPPLATLKMEIMGHNFWKGLNATLLRDGIPHGVWFVSYEWCKTSMMIHREQQDTTITGTNNNNAQYNQLVVPLVSGAFAATVAWAVGYPFDIIKTRIQATAIATTTTTTSPNIPKGVYATAMELIEESNGHIWKGLYRGFGLKLIRAIPASMIGFTTYEFVAGTLRKE